MWFLIFQQSGTVSAECLILHCTQGLQFLRFTLMLSFFLRENRPKRNKEDVIENNSSLPPPSGVSSRLLSSQNHKLNEIST